MQTTTQQTTILQIGKETFKSAAIDDPSPLLIDFWAPWCGPCRAMKPILEEAAVALQGTVRVAQVNVDDEPQIAEVFGIRSIPTLVLIRDQRAVQAVSGVMPAAEVVRWVQSGLEKGGEK